MNILGIDPGKTGAAAFISDGKFIYLWDYSDGPANVREIELLNALYGVSFVFIEKTGAGVFGKRFDQNMGSESVSRMGSVSAFSFGENNGHWKGILDAFKIPFKEVRPTDWMKNLVPKKKDKQDKPSLIIAKRIFPEAPITLKKHNGRADALLIAWYGHLTLMGGGKI